MEYYTAIHRNKQLTTYIDESQKHCARFKRTHTIGSHLYDIKGKAKL